MFVLFYEENFVFKQILVIMASSMSVGLMAAESNAGTERPHIIESDGSDDDGYSTESSSIEMPDNFFGESEGYGSKPSYAKILVGHSESDEDEYIDGEEYDGVPSAEDDQSWSLEAWPDDEDECQRVAEIYWSQFEISPTAVVEAHPYSPDYDATRWDRYDHKGRVENRRWQREKHKSKPIISRRRALNEIKNSTNARRVAKLRYALNRWNQKYRGNEQEHSRSTVTGKRFKSHKPKSKAEVLADQRNQFPIVKVGKNSGKGQTRRPKPHNSTKNKAPIAEAQAQVGDQSIELWVSCMQALWMSHP